MSTIPVEGWRVSREPVQLPPAVHRQKDVDQESQKMGMQPAKIAVTLPKQVSLRYYLRGGGSGRI